ncbi:MAG: hypothetical protein E7252_05455 [Lachnospira sp.]|nr:hypothetical protein [Lachnospira sp.]
MKCKKNIIITIIIVLSFLIAVVIWFAYKIHQNKQKSYTPDIYTREEVLQLYEDNKEQFKEVVDILANSEEFHEKGRVYEGDYPFLSNPYDKMQYFTEEDRIKLKEFFEHKPYMLTYRGQSVKITFINDKRSMAYTFLFWFGDDERFEEHLSYLRQNNYVEIIEDKIIIYEYVGNGQ